MNAAFFRKKNTVTLLTLYICFVFIQSLFFKYSGAPETVYIFETIDLWATNTFGISGLFVPPGIFNGYVVATAELVAAVILLIGLFTARKAFIPLGALMALGVISGAIFFHLFTPLGIEVQGDGGTLFFMACGVFVSAAILVLTQRELLLSFLCKRCKRGK